MDSCAQRLITPAGMRHPATRRQAVRSWLRALAQDRRCARQQTTAAASAACAMREKERPDVLTSRGGGSGRRLPHRRNGQEHPIKAAAAPSAVRKSSADPDRRSTNRCPTAPATVVSMISPGSSCASSEPSSAAEPFRSSRRHCLPAARRRHGYGHRVRGDGYRQ